MSAHLFVQYMLCMIIALLQVTAQAADDKATKRSVKKICHIAATPKQWNRKKKIVMLQCSWAVLSMRRQDNSLDSEARVELPPIEDALKFYGAKAPYINPPSATTGSCFVFNFVGAIPTSYFANEQYFLNAFKKKHEQALAQKMKKLKELEPEEAYFTIYWYKQLLLKSTNNDAISAKSAELVELNSLLNLYALLCAARKDENRGV
jgi:hypothetical protein